MMSSGTTRHTFSEAEKVCLQELIIKYKINSVATVGIGNPSAKKIAWVHLTQEYNSIETNCKRTEAQLKKCWDNLKTRRKLALAQEKRERMRTGGGSCVPNMSQNSQAIDAALLDATNIELQCVFDSDVDMLAIDPSTPVPTTPAPAAPTAIQSSDETILQTQEPIPVEIDDLEQQHAHHANNGTPSQVLEPDEILKTPQRASARSRLFSHGASSQTIVPKNIRAHVINEEFTLRKSKYEVAQNGMKSYIS